MTVCQAGSSLQPFCSLSWQLPSDMTVFGYIFTKSCNLMEEYPGTYLERRSDQEPYLEPVPHQSQRVARDPPIDPNLENGKPQSQRGIHLRADYNLLQREAQYFQGRGHCTEGQRYSKGNFAEETGIR
ncbi:hypothetical protein FGO68_gene17604 [Halteria grandinella]|uniref:Uncharacterized protein n=1 Tax=Halteria grandinella TaxID=5974 RepID=A0A8J8SYL7_HALGN|nr:hypothetical protein FGO68_gene17604 [Halteria grandinella]